MEPVRGPNAVNTPSQHLQDRLTKAVAVPGGPGAMVACAIAFDTQNVSTRLKGIDHRQIEEEPGAAHLCMHDVAQPGQLSENLFLELGVRRPLGLRGHVHLTRFRVMQERFQRSHARRTGLGYIEVLGAHGREYLAAPARATDQHVQAALPAGPIEGTETHRQVALFRTPVANTDEDDVALVTLHVLQVLDKTRLVRRVRKELFAGRIPPAQEFHLVQDGIHLSDAKGGYSKCLPLLLGERQLASGMRHYRRSNRFRLYRISARAATLVGSILQATVHQPQSLSIPIRTGKY